MKYFLPLFLLLVLATPAHAAVSWTSTASTVNPLNDLVWSTSANRFSCGDMTSPYTACPSFPFTPGMVVTVTGGKNNGKVLTVSTVTNTTPGRDVRMVFVAGGGIVNGLETNGTTVTLTEVPVLGCTDPDAVNYDPDATEDDGSCVYVVPGCTDPEATNYDPAANEDDGSCEYPGGGGGAFIDDSRDLITGQVAAFGLAGLGILAAIILLIVALLVFYWGWKQVTKGAGVSSGVSGAYDYMRSYDNINLDAVSRKIKEIERRG